MKATTPTTSAIGLRPGEFYGTAEETRSADAFDVKLMQASGREADVHLHAHDDAHFVLALSGVYLSTASGAPEYASAPFLVFNPPGTTHRDRFLKGAGTFMTVSMSNARFQHAGQSDRFERTARALPGTSVIRAAFAIARSIRAKNSSEIEIGSWDLFARAIDTRCTWHTPPRWAHVAFEALMDEAARPDLSVAQLARAVGVHPVHLARVFRRAWGVSPADVLRWRRAENAVRLLGKSQWSAAAIATSVGFVDQSHMSRTLRSLYGTTPGECRRAMLRRYNTGRHRRS